MGFEIERAIEEVEANKDGGNSGGTVVPSVQVKESPHPPVASSPTSLRTAKSLPTDLSSESLASAKGSSIPRTESSCCLKSFLKKFKGRKDSRQISNGQSSPNDTGGAADTSEGEESFRWTSPWVDPDKVYGFEEELQALDAVVRIQNDGGFKAIGVIGVGGIGKTTLCQLLFNKEEIKEEFLPRIWVNNSREPNDDKDLKVAIVSRMLTQIGEDFSEGELDKLQMLMNSRIDDHAKQYKRLDVLMSLLHRNLWGKKYLIVLDDARGADPWYCNLGAVPNNQDPWQNRLAYGLPKGSGGRVVVSSRNEEVARKMVGEYNLHKVMPLSDPDHCWRIFEESAELDEDAKKRISTEAMRRDVQVKSAGIALAVKLMGQIMKEQLQEELLERINRTATA